MSTTNDYEIKAYHQTIADFAKKEIRPGALESDRFPFADFNHQIIHTLSKNEFLCPTLPESAGGPGAGIRVLGAMLEEIAREDASTALTILIQSMACTLLIESGKSDWMKKWIGDPLKNNSDLLALPVYNDPANLLDSIHAVAKENGFLLNGSLNYIPCLPVAKAVIVPARMEESDTIHWFVIECETPGVSMSDPIVSLGLRGCPVSDLKLQNVFLPDNSLLLDGKNEAMRYEKLCERFRGPLTAISLGILKGAYTAALSYAKNRYQGKKQIIEHDMIRMMLSNMISWIDIASVAADYACQLADHGEPYPPSVLLSIQNLVATAVTRATTDGVQILGGYGYMHEFGQEKRMRDAKQIQAVFGSLPLKKLEILKRNI